MRSIRSEPHYGDATFSLCFRPVPGRKLYPVESGNGGFNDVQDTLTLGMMRIFGQKE